MAYSNRDYLNLYEQMELYALLAAVESLDKITEWQWLDGKNCQIRRHQYKCMRITEPRQYKRCEYEIGGGDGLSD